LEEVEARVLDAPQLIYKVSKLNGISYSWLWICLWLSSYFRIMI
jgi:hypothetical protein